MSPWFLNNDVSPAGAPVAGLLADRNAQLSSDFANFGKFASVLGAGAVGAFQGLKDPSVFGAGTGGTAGAFKGAAANINGLNGGTNFKQLQMLGKSADAFRSALKTGMPKIDGQEDQPVLGMTDDEWATKGALERFNTVGQAVKAQAQQEVVGRIADYAAIAQQRQAQGKFGKMVGDYTTANPDKPLDGPTLLKFAAQAGLRGQDALNYVKSMQDVSMGPGGDRFQFDPDKMVQPLKDMPGHMFVQTSKGGGQVVETPEALAGEIMATKPAAEDVPNGYMPLRVGKGWKVVPDETQFKTTRDPFSGTVTREFVGGGKTNMTPPDGAPSALPLNGGKVDATKLKDGQIYTTAKGPATWNATKKQFSLVEQ